MGAYSVTVLGGLEEIARREIEERLSGAEVRPAATRGSAVAFTSSMVARRRTFLRCGR